MVGLEHGAEVIDGRWIVWKTLIFIGRYKPLTFVATILPPGEWYLNKSTGRTTRTILDPHSPPAFCGLSHIVSPALTQATRAIIEEFLFWPLTCSEE